MRPLTTAQLERLRELVADEQLDQLSIEDRSELEELREQAGIGEHSGGAIAELTARVGTDGVEMPEDVRARLLMRGQRLVASGGRVALGADRIAPGTAQRRGVLPRLLIAASLLLACGMGYYAYTLNTQRAAALATAHQAELELASARAANSELLAAAESKAEELAARVRSSDARIAALDQKLAETAAREVRLARDLDDATRRLDSATLKIAKLEAPIDPLEVAGNRRKLMEVPGTVRVAWAPFDLPDAPSEQREVRGDVVWNDDLKQGFLRFEGLKPNDPKTEQYQVWVIDERGMEQKVSGGVFNALATGEVVVPITPAIDVRKVALFAVTIEEPGGTWVPNLKRRVVVAPRGN